VDAKAKTVFVRYLPKGYSHSELYDELLKNCSADKIKSLKVSIDPECNRSRKFGFASFTTKEAADKYKEITNQHIEIKKAERERWENARYKEMK